MEEDLRIMKENGADGVVFGLLLHVADGTVDEDINCADLLRIARPMSTTFHRAFDMVKDPHRELEVLIRLGFDRILTSGCDSTALEGLPVIKQLMDQAGGRITIVPGGGITERNLERILIGTGAKEFHCSARSSKSSLMQCRNTLVTMGATYGASEYLMKIADTKRVTAFVRLSQTVHDLRSHQ